MVWLKSPNGNVKLIEIFNRARENISPRHLFIFFVAQVVRISDHRRNNLVAIIVPEFHPPRAFFLFCLWPQRPGLPITPTQFTLTKSNRYQCLVVDVVGCCVFSVYRCYHGDRARVDVTFIFRAAKHISPDWFPCRDVDTVMSLFVRNMRLLKTDYLFFYLLQAPSHTPLMVLAYKIWSSEKISFHCLINFVRNF